MTNKKTYTAPTVVDLGSVAALTLSHNNTQGTDAFLASLNPNAIGPQPQPGGNIIGS